MSLTYIIAFTLVVFSNLINFLFGQVKLVFVLLVATYETLGDICFDLDVFVRYDLYEVYHSMFREYSGDAEMLEEQPDRRTLVVPLLLVLWFCSILWMILPLLSLDKDDIKCAAAIDRSSPSRLQHRAPIQAITASQIFSASPSDPSEPPPPPPAYLFQTFEHFNGTGDSFQPHLQPNPQQDPTTYPLPRSSFLDEDIEAGYGTMRKFDKYKGWYWHHETTTLGKRPSNTVMIEAPIEAQPTIQVAKQPQGVAIVGPSTQDFTTLAAVAPPSEYATGLAVTAPLYEDVTASAGDSLAPSPGPFVTSATVSAPPTEKLLPVACQAPPPPPPPTFEMICSDLAQQAHGLQDLITELFTKINSSGDCSGEIQSLARGFGAAFQALSMCRTQLTSDESKHMGWFELLEGLYANVHPHAYRLMAFHSNNSDMLDFLQGVRDFGRFMGLMLPDLDFTPPPPPQAPTAPLPTPTNMPEVNQAAIWAPPVAPSVFSALPGPPSASATMSLPPIFSSSGIKPASSRAPGAASRTPRPNAQRKNVGAPRQAATRDTLPATTKAVAQATTVQTPVKRMLNFDNLKGWNELDNEEFAGLTVASFGWSENGTASKFLMQFSPGKDLVLGGSRASGCSADFVTSEVDDKAGALKRAAWVLHWQGSANFHWKADSDSAPTLLGDITTFLGDVEAKVDSAKARDSLRDDADDFWKAFRILFNKFRKNKHLEEGLAMQYSQAEYDTWWSKCRLIRGMAQPAK
ncbi:hypothetical protein NX059_004756 [Plenodomus lindquistii]|nr:hypothetical protein NX059_004756 [Plenodomus lindquistii]